MVLAHCYDGPKSMVLTSGGPVVLALKVSLNTKGRGISTTVMVLAH